MEPEEDQAVAVPSPSDTPNDLHEQARTDGAQVKDQDLGVDDRLVRVNERQANSGLQPGR
jgi:hypothetical protein